MPRFHFDQYTLNYLAQLIITLVITSYLVSLPNKTTAIRWLLPAG